MQDASGPRQPRTEDNSTRLPACDSCKSRKTKCDRGNPCSSCVTAGLDCRVTRARPEKRQRILISTRYDEALESVDTRLQEVLQTVVALQRDGLKVNSVRDSAPASSHQKSLQTTSDFPSSSTTTELPGHVPTHKGFRGEPSFDARVHQLAGSLKDLATNLPLLQGIEENAKGLQAVQHILDRSADPGVHQARVVVTSPRPFLEQHPELSGCDLPSSDAVLRLLRLVQAEKQRFFVDVAFLEESRFIEMCREVFFAVNPYTLSTWSLVNTGLYYLFFDLNPQKFPEIGQSLDDVHTIKKTLATNAQAAAESFRATSDPSLEMGQALALSSTFCLKSGQIAKAWDLMSSAARMCIDLGLHRQTTAQDRSPAELTRRKLFWYVYFWDKSLALTLGRTQCIPQYDVSMERLSYPVDVPGIPGKISAALTDTSIILSDMIFQLFSASAQRLHPNSRAQKVHQFRTSLQQIRSGLGKAPDDPSVESKFNEGLMLLEYLLDSLVTVVCSASRAERPALDARGRGHACADCIGPARCALELLVRTGTKFMTLAPQGWTIILNIFLSFCPFTPYLTLVVHTISAHDLECLEFLNSVNRIMSQVAEESEVVRDTLDTCQKLHQLARSIVMPSAEVNVPMEDGDGIIRSDFATESVFSVDTPGQTMPMVDWQLMAGDVSIDPTSLWRPT